MRKHEETTESDTESAIRVCWHASQFANFSLVFLISQAFNLTWQLDASAQTSARISRMRPGVRFFMPILTSSNEKSISTRTITERY